MRLLFRWFDQEELLHPDWQSAHGEVCQRTTALCKQRFRVYYTVVRIRHAHAFAQSAKSADRCIDNRNGNVLVFSRACTIERWRGKRCPELEIPATHECSGPASCCSRRSWPWSRKSAISTPFPSRRSPCAPPSTGPRFMRTLKTNMRFLWTGHARSFNGASCASFLPPPPCRERPCTA